MMRPPLISTDICRSPPSARFLLSALVELDLRLLPLLAVDVHALSLELRDGGLGEVGAIGARWCLLDHLELPCDLRRSVEGLRIHDPDPELVRPDQRVDLVHLPLLMPTRQCGAVLQDDLHAIARVITAIDPTLERRSQELPGGGLVLLVLDPVIAHEDLVLEHRRAGAL